MAEAVTHNVSGLLFERGNADDLAKQLKRLLEEEDLLEKLRAGIPQVKSVEQAGAELEHIYIGLTKSQINWKLNKGIVYE
jgi:hypothetical protein